MQKGKAPLGIKGLIKLLLALCLGVVVFLLLKGLFRICY
jgi:hypothetical protein